MVAKAAGAEAADQIRNKKLHLIAPRNTFVNQNK
jgi:hypothetical protein